MIQKKKNKKKNVLFHCSLSFIVLFLLYRIETIKRNEMKSNQIKCLIKLTIKIFIKSMNALMKKRNKI